jgi:hypothetical protein
MVRQRPGEDNVQDNGHKPQASNGNGLSFDQPDLVHLTNEKASFSARMSFAMMYARMSTTQLRQRMLGDYGITLSKSTMSKILNKKTRRTRYFLEMADIMGVNPRWLATGKENMVDSTGRLSNRDQAAKDVKRLVKQYLVPPKRSDLVRFHDKLVGIMAANRLSRHNVDLLENILSTVLNSYEDQKHEQLTKYQGGLDHSDRVED